jgi:hypothetical protein
MKYVKLLLLMVFFIMIFSCEPALKQGEVYNRKFVPAHTQMIMMPVVHVASVGKTTTTYTTLTPIWFFYPDSWEISYKAFNQKKNKWETATIYTTKEIYSLASVGSWYERTEKDFVEQPRLKTEAAK